MTDDPMIARDQLLLQESLNLVAPVAGELVATFYDKLFAAHPELRGMFPAELTAQREKLLKAIIAVVTHFDQPEQLQPALTAMGRTHVRHGVGLAHYAIVGEILLETLREYAGAAWNPPYEAAWARMYTFAAGTMMAASAHESVAETRDGTRQAA
jgi:hemoglobin-like flavoprotein